MALEINYTINNQSVKCKLTVNSILGNGANAAAYAEIASKVSGKFVAGRLFEFNAQTENDFHSAYEHIKNLPEFADAIDL